MTWPAVHISQSIDVPTDVVIAFVGNPANLPEWAAGLSAGIRCEHGRWVTDSPMGIVQVAFVGPVEAGVLDHDVTLPDGTVFHNPMRVLRNDGGSEVVFTLFRTADVDDAQFELDARTVGEDLLRLRDRLTGR